MEPKQQIEQLTRELEHAGYLYYVLDNPEMSDYDYDHKLRQLEELEAQYPQYASPLSPTRRVGGQALSEFVKVRHAVPLESLQDVFSFDELRDFDAHVREEEPDAEYSVEPKVDGLSVALEYVDGRFVRGATRGDGLIGEDVTENLKTVRSIPMTLEHAPARLIVRGEVFMPRASFEALNAEQEKLGKPLFANPRNAAAGSCASWTRAWRQSGSSTFSSSTCSWQRASRSGRTAKRLTICGRSNSRSYPTRSAAIWTKRSS